MGSGSSPAVWHSRVAGTSVCERWCALVPAERDVGGDRSITSGALGGLGGSFPFAGSLTLPQSPTHSSCPCGNGSRIGEGAVGLCQGGLSCSYILGPRPSLQGGKRKCLDLKGSCESFLLSSSPHLLSSFCFSLLHRHLLTLPLSPVQDSPTGAGAEELGQQELT